MNDAKDTATVTGRCLCNAVSFEASVHPRAHICHCGMCRRWAGGPGMGVSADSVTFTSGEDNIERYASSDWAWRGFCKTCGSNLFYQLRDSARGGYYALWAGALDDVSGLILHSEIYVDDKPGFYDFAGAHPRLSGAEFRRQLGV